MNQNVLNTESFAILQRISQYTKKWKNISKKVSFEYIFPENWKLVLLSIRMEGFPAVPKLLISFDFL